MRKLTVTAVIVVLLLAVGVAVVLGQLGRLVERGVEEVGPEVTGTDVQLDGARVSIFSGEGSLSGLQVGNPKGYSEDRAFHLGKIGIALDPKSVAADVVRIRSVVIDAPKLLVEFDANGRTNLQAILDHVRKVARQPAGKDRSAEGPGKKFIVDDFRITGMEVHAVSKPYGLDERLMVPEVRLRNLGAKQGGAAASEIAEQILRPVVDRAVAAARDEYLERRRGELKQKAREKLREESQELLNRLGR